MALDFNTSEGMLGAVAVEWREGLGTSAMKKPFVLVDFDDKVQSSPRKLMAGDSDKTTVIFQGGRTGVYC
jgi:hypothetical protein